MYFQLHEQTRYGDQAWTIAELQTTISFSYHEQNDFWSDEPIAAPPAMTFSFHPDAPLFDCYWNDSFFPLYAQRLIELIRQTNMRHETFPVTILDRLTQRKLTVPYQIFRLRETHEALDKKLSIYETKHTASTSYEMLKKPVLSNAFVAKQIPLCRLQEQRNRILIHENLKTTFEKAGITGFWYEPMEQS